MEPELSEIERAYEQFTPRRLARYDAWVFGILNPLVWRCPTEELLEHYRTHISENHLEVGVGTGYLPDKTLKDGHIRVALLDANRDCLVKASNRLERYRPELHQENLLEPLDIHTAGFDSIALNYVLHCLPGNLELKTEKVFDYLLPFLHENGTLFGATLLGSDIQRPLLARFLMNRYNQKGWFCNENDSLGAVMEALSSRFRTFNVEVHGCVVLFSGKGIKDSYREALETKRA